MTRYDVFNQLRELTAMVSIPDGFSKMVQTGGSYEYADYGVGYLEFVVYKYNSQDKGWIVVINLQTIDDGGYVGRVSVKDEQAADVIVTGVASNILKSMVSLPRLEDLNVLLRPYGLYVTCE